MAKKSAVTYDYKALGNAMIDCVSDWLKKDRVDEHLISWEYSKDFNMTGNIVQYGDRLEIPLKTPKGKKVVVLRATVK